MRRIRRQGLQRPHDLEQVSEMLMDIASRSGDS